MKIAETVCVGISIRDICQLREVDRGGKTERSSALAREDKAQHGADYASRPIPTGAH